MAKGRGTAKRCRVCPAPRMPLARCLYNAQGNPMLLEVKCYATLAKYQPGDEDFLLGPNPTLRDLVGFLGIPEGELKISFVNGVHAELDHELHEGDRVGLFPAVGGG